MSIILYRKGGCVKIDRDSLHSYLKNGWRLTLEEAETCCKENVEELCDLEEVEEELNVDEDDSENEDEGKAALKRLNLDELTDDEIRITAKELKIANWYNKGIPKLKGEIRAS